MSEGEDLLGSSEAIADAEIEIEGDATEGSSEKKRSRVIRNFPALSFEECEKFAGEIYKLGSGNPVRRLTLFNTISKSPESSASRALITNAAKYGLTKGSYKSEQLELTSDGRVCVSEDVGTKDRVRTRFRLAIETVQAFKGLYEQNLNLKRPANSALADAVQAFGVPKDAAEEAIETFVVNLKYVGLLVSVSGAERIVSLDHALDSVGSGSEPVLARLRESPASAATVSNATDLSNTCFYVTPIGAEDSENRKHSDLFLGAIVEPALQSLGLHVVRADRIQKAGAITRQVLELLLGAKLVIADLSFHNPNVFYELAVRHMTRKPVVQIVRKGDGIPFDINQLRTIEIDNSSIYELVPRLETYKAEIASQARAALEDAEVADNPMATYFPDLKVSGLPHF